MRTLIGFSVLGLILTGAFLSSTPQSDKLGLQANCAIARYWRLDIEKCSGEETAIDRPLGKGISLFVE
jgi:hypothetical protein